jgi:hypothetical protein
LDDTFEFSGEITSEQNVSQSHQVNINYSDHTLDEFTLFTSRSKEKNQWLETKFANHLEDYAKSFQFVSKYESVYADLKNVIEKPMLLSSSKKSEKIIYDNQMKKYEKQLKIDLESVKMLKEKKSSSDDLTLELRKRQTTEAKLELANMYLSSKLKEFKEISEVDDQLKKSQKFKIACEYYKMSEASRRVFVDDNILAKKIKTDLEIILKKLNDYLGK